MTSHDNEDIDEAFDEATTPLQEMEKKLKLHKSIELSMPKNTSYMNRGPWKYQAAERDKYLWVNGTKYINLCYLDHEYVILVGTDKDVKKIPCEDIYDGMRKAEEIMEKYR